ncbi:unnamed protein product [Lampetra planeri]
MINPLLDERASAKTIAVLQDPPMQRSNDPPVSELISSLPSPQRARSADLHFIRAVKKMRRRMGEAGVFCAETGTGAASTRPATEEETSEQTAHNRPGTHPGFKVKVKPSWCPCWSWDCQSITLQLYSMLNATLVGDHFHWLL